MAQLDRDPVAELDALAAERGRLVAEARGRLAGYPQAVLNEFEFSLKAAQQAVVVAEDHNFWIDNRSLYQLRRVLLEFGHRLAAAGAIDDPNDVFYLRLRELRATAAALPEADRRRLVADRKAEMDHFRTIAPPPALGTPPPGGPRRGPRVRAMAKFNGAALEPSTDPGAVRGHAGAPGKVRGRARVLRSLAEAGRLERGDVLVTVTLGPPWTPLFATAAAVVTEIGGVLSHGAVVAREVGLPAVVGVAEATTRIKSGQRLKVNGADGTVELL
jgi:pyruvate,water dikinase